MSQKRTLILARHADSANKSPGMTDEQRPLTPQGRADASAAGRKLAALLVEPALVLASTALRTRETAALISEMLGITNTPIDFDERLYLAEKESITAVIAETPASVTSLLVVAHNPGISEAFASLVRVGARGMPPAAMAIITFDTSDWQTAVSSKGDLIAYEFPSPI